MKAFVARDAASTLKSASGHSRRFCHACDMSAIEPISNRPVPPLRTSDYLDFIKLASIQIHVRAYESTP
jgi:hypothetical protein